MKEILAVIRMNMVNKTKEALLLEGFPAITCRKVVGRGKKKIDFSIAELITESDVDVSTKVSEEISELHRLVPKRMVSVYVNDEDAKEVVDIIINANKTGNAGDGKIFVSDVTEAVRIRTGEKDSEAI